MYIYHVLTDALSTHMIRTVNQNTIFSTHVQQSPTIANAVYIRYSLKQRNKKGNKKVGAMMNEFKLFVHMHARTHIHMHAPPTHPPNRHTGTVVKTGY